MTDNKVIRVLRTFSLLEFRQLCRFVRAPLPTKDKYILRLIDALEPHYPEFPEAAVHRNIIYPLVYHKEAFDMPRLRRLFSNFTILVEDFMVKQEISISNTPKLPFLKTAYRKRQLDNYYSHLLVLEEKELHEQPLRDAEHHYRQFRLRDEQYQFQSGKQNRSIELDPKSILDSLEAFYLCSKLRVCCEMVNRGNILNTKAETSWVAELLSKSSAEQYKDIAAIALYRSILLTLTEPEEVQHYLHLKSLLLQSNEAFTRRELKDIYALAQNYCIRKINNGQADYLKELFQLYQALLQNRILMDDGHLSQYQYKNIVFVALRLNEFDWCKSFIENYSVWLKPEEKENAYTYNMAYYHFFEKDYKNVLKLLMRVEFTDVFYFLDSRSLLLKSFYELDEVDPLLTLLDTFQSALKRNKLISDSQRVIYLNLVKVVRKLMKLQPRNKEQVKKLGEYIDKNRQIADRAWVLSKLEDVRG
jgi:hypothetical protein